MSIYIREDDFLGSTSFPFLSYPATKKKENCVIRVKLSFEQY